MGILADFFVATDDEARRYDGGEFAPEDARAQSKGLTILEMSTLWAAFEQRTWDVALLEHFAELRMEDGGERMTHRLPAALVDHLATGSADRIVEAVKRWAKTDEINSPPAQLAPLVGDLVRLARRARQEGQGFYLWNCV